MTLLTQTKMKSAAKRASRSGEKGLTAGAAFVLMAVVSSSRCFRCSGYSAHR